MLFSRVMQMLESPQLEGKFFILVGKLMNAQYRSMRKRLRTKVGRVGKSLEAKYLNQCLSEMRDCIYLSCREQFEFFSLKALRYACSMFFCSWTLLSLLFLND